jgi:hypothetical protein
MNFVKLDIIIEHYTFTSSGVKNNVLYYIY